MKREQFLCSCYSTDHQVIIDWDDEDKTLSFDLMVNDYLRWYQKLWRAVKYVCQNQEILVNNCMMSRHQTKDFIRMLNRLEENNNENK